MIGIERECLALPGVMDAPALPPNPPRTAQFALVWVATLFFRGSVGFAFTLWFRLETSFQPLTLTTEALGTTTSSGLSLIYFSDQTMSFLFPMGFYIIHPLYLYFKCLTDATLPYLS